MLPFNMGAGGASGAYTGDIPASLRFRSAASANMTKTPSGAGNRQVWTYSTWVKRGALSSDMLLLDAGVDGNNESSIWLNASNQLDVFNYTSAVYRLRKTTNMVFRDPTSWVHLVVASNSSTSFKIYVNGVEVTSFSTDTGTNGFDWFFNHSSYTMYIGKRLNSTNYFDGYLSRICFVDGTALTPSSFGYLNTEINEWVSKSQSAVKAVVDAGGTNSFMLDFDDATSLTTLGYDKSSKGNNWTLNNVSLTAGSTYDWMLDVPGNSYCTASPIDLGANPGSSSLTEANLKSACSAVSGGSSTCGTQALPAGKWYWEFTPTTIGNGLVLGITSRTSGTPSGTAVGYTFDGTKNIAGSGSAYGATYAANDIIGVAVDTTANTIEFFKNNASQGVITNSTYIVPGCKPLHWNNSSSGSSTVQHCYGQAPLHASATYDSASGGYFRYAPPTGYKALCQRNLPDPAITNPELHFDVVTRTGTAATYSVAGLGFQPDLVWVKSRGRAVDHALYDSVRGVQKQLESNQTGVETTESTGLTAFNSGGYTGGALDQINGTTATNSFVDWLWKAGGAAVTNNAGSISSQVSANVEAGFSIVTYTGTGANATVGHGLGKAPGLVIVKGRNTTAASNWPVWHRSLNGGAPTNYVLFLNLTNAQGVNGTYWNSADPSSTVVSLGTAAEVNENTKNYVAYCFAEIAGYSNIFSYTGNGSADGPFVHCGFKPKFILVKRTDSSTYGNWEIIDTVRDTYNQSFNDLIANLSNAENVDGASWDILSNGFKCRDGSSTGNKNVSGGTYIGIAFADVPAKYSLAR